MKTDCWRPNWKNKDEYPDPKITPGYKWAWEFIRRNPLYQKDFNLFKKSKSKEERLRIWNEWGFEKHLEIFDPKKNNPLRLKLAFTNFPRSFGLQKGELDEEYICNPFRTNSEQAVIFDLSLPIDKQILEARSFLLKSRKFSKIKPERANNSIHKDKLPDYLRVLDAKDSCAKTPEIIEIFFPAAKNNPKRTDRNEKLKSILKKARLYRDQDFKTLFTFLP
jgi:hypothetical protein